MIRTALQDLVGVDAPVVCTGMGFVSDPTLAAAVCNGGALGIVAAAMMTLPELEAAVAQMNQMTRRPYGVNLRSDAPDLDDRARVLIDGGVKVASFALAPDPAVMGRLKEAGLVCIPSVGARKHAEKVAGWGADAVIAQGAEAGGHTGNVPTSLLVPQIVDSVDIPVIAAGGFFDGRGLIAAMAYGAAGIAMGTRFLLTRESPVPMSMKQRYLRTQITETVVTSSIDGHPHRVIRTEFIADLERHGLVREFVGALRNARQFQQLSRRSWPSILRQSWTLKRQHDYSLRQLVMAANAPMLCRAAMVDGREDIGVLSSGQVVGIIDDIPSCGELIARIMAEADGVLGALKEPVSTALAAQLCGPAGSGLLDGKVVVITAAAGTGIGGACARRCLAEGAQVFISDIHERRLEHTADDLGVGSMPCDVTRSGAIEELLDAAEDTYGPVDVLVNNAGLGGDARITDLTDSDWDRVLAVTLTSAFRGTRAALRRMVPRGRGSVVNIASITGWRAEPGQSHYAAAKAGVMALTRSAGVEVAAAGVRVNAVAPTVARHPYLDKVSSKEVIAEWVRHQPQGRAAEPGEIANVVAFLSSDYASYLSGEVISVGGQHP